MGEWIDLEGRIVDVDPDFFLYNILLVDDEQGWIDETKAQLLENTFCRVDTAMTAKEASQFIRSKNYDAKLVDVMLSRGRSLLHRQPQGDEWIAENIDRLKGGLLAVVTANESAIKCAEFLEQNGIPIVTKSQDEEFDLLEQVKKNADEKHKWRVDRIKRFFSDLSKASFEPQAESLVVGSNMELETKVKQLFVDWLRSRPDSFEEDVWIGGRLFSSETLADQLDQTGPMNDYLMRMFVRQMRRKLGLDNGELDTSRKRRE